MNKLVHEPSAGTNCAHEPQLHCIIIFSPCPGTVFVRLKQTETQFGKPKLTQFGMLLTCITFETIKTGFGNLIG